MGVVTLTVTQQNTRTWRKKLVGKWEMKKLFGRLRSGREYILKLILQTKCENMERSQLVSTALFLVKVHLLMKEFSGSLLTR
jgi:hypothetical protein